jgi:tRNA (guanine-N7-)-methyltransferase
MTRDFTSGINRVINLVLFMSRSVSSPEFRYAPSKNIYWEKLKNLPEDLRGLAFTDHDTETHRGSWRKAFRSTQQKEMGSETPLHVEIGCNAGHVCLEWAKQNPNALYIGIDWKFKQIYRLAEKSKKFQVGNLLAFRANADRLPFMFEQGEIDYLHMFFPDPWPKKAQKKNRTADREWLLSIAPLISEKGYFHLKTDHAEYFEFILENLNSLSDTYEILEMTRDLHAGNPNAKLLTIPAVTLFERLFIKDGLPIHSVKVRRK